MSKKNFSYRNKRLTTWNQKYGHIPYADRMGYYIRRSERFKNKRGGSDEQHVQICDQPAPNAEERALKQHKDVEALGKGKGIQAASAAAKGKPNPAILFSVFWDRGDTARWGYPSVQEFLQDKADQNLPYQRGAPGGAAGDAQGKEQYLGPYSAEQIFTCLQCNEPSAIINLWNCDRCSKMMGHEVHYHCRSRHKNCYEEHAHYCESKALFGWQRPEKKREDIEMPAATPTS